MKLKTNDKILFIGDSITEEGRSESDSLSLGQGYPLLIASQLLTKYPLKKFIFYNRGKGGDTLSDLVNRWVKDCLNLTPDVVSILIGVNDTWNNMSRRRELTEKELDTFESNYRYLLKSLYHRTDARVVLMEPFVLPYLKDRNEWRRDLDQRIQVIRRLARDYQVDLIPLDGILNARGLKNGFTYYTEEDGVHPTIPGHGEIAKVWINNIDLIETY